MRTGRHLLNGLENQGKLRETQRRYHLNWTPTKRRYGTYKSRTYLRYSDNEGNCCYEYLDTGRMYKSLESLKKNN
jgi:hypothetical protein